jgi:hypothetical protein
MTDNSVRDKNDSIRENGNFGPGTENPLLVTPGVQALGDEAIATLYTDIMTYDNFSEAIDPDGNHDMGVLSFNDIEVWFRIDQTENPDVRLFTLFLPEER